jgi:hypothetical protein
MDPENKGLSEIDPVNKGLSKIDLANKRLRASSGLRTSELASQR